MKSRRKASSRGDAEEVVAGDQEVALGLAVAARRRRLGVAAEGRDLDHLAVVEVDVDQAEAPADDPRVAEQPADLVRAGVGADVEVLGPPPEHQVAHAPPHQVGLVAGAVQPVHDLEGVAADVLAGDRVVLPRQDQRRHPTAFTHPAGLYRRVAIAGLTRVVWPAGGDQAAKGFSMTRLPKRRPGWRSSESRRSHSAASAVSTMRASQKEKLWR